MRHDHTDGRQVDASSPYLHQDVTDIIIGSFYAVYNVLGFGLLEAAYTRALQMELKVRGVDSRREVPFRAFYRGEVIGGGRADLLVDDRVLVEVKAAQRWDEVFERQLRNYLGCSTYEVGLVLNFGREPRVKRELFTNDRKSVLSRPNQSHP